MKKSTSELISESVETGGVFGNYLIGGCFMVHIFHLGVGFSLVSWFGVGLGLVWGWFGVGLGGLGLV